MICCGLPRDDIHLHSGKKSSFLHAKLLLYEVGTEKGQSLNCSRQIPIYTDSSVTVHLHKESGKNGSREEYDRETSSHTKKNQEIQQRFVTVWAAYAKQRDIFKSHLA